METCSLAELEDDLKAIGVDPGRRPYDFSQSTRPSDEMIDRWAKAALLAEPEIRAIAIWAIGEAALRADIVPASVQELYVARAAGKWSNRTVPAMNLRGWTYQTCRAVFQAARELDAQLFIFEQAVSEQVFAAQSPAEYTAGVLAAALREGHEGPVFLQADHDQVNAAAWAKDKAAEIQRLERIIEQQIAAGFYNIDLDASTVVDLSLANVEDQQRANAELTAHFTAFVRGLEPEGVTISLGGEIGEVGHDNTTPEELHAFMSVYGELLRAKGGNLAPISKISINTGTHHGGKVLPDGTLAAVDLDYDLLRTISDLSREHYGMGGAVQHGASTLPGEQLAKLPPNGAVEVHLALGFNNLIFDHPSLPQAIKDEINDYTFTHHAAERGPGETDAQFLYNTRKKSWKVMKQRFYDIPAAAQAEIMDALRLRFRDMFTWMNVGGTRELVRELTTVTKIPPPVPAASRKAAHAG
ncbi:MAG: class II fructose-bisphosphate aldolase [Geminicoccaceae bacterium]